VALAALTSAATSASRSRRTSTTCTFPTSGLVAAAAARKRPHQPVPMTPTSMVSTILIPVPDTVGQYDVVTGDPTSYIMYDTLTSG